ncbi:hypothetical protein DOTSEDRAFT_31436 [Dothistroma septosporum NZE10]|uniref:Uncharacterized protein n=1 Tax=Dothistroma septosporum (strain NZE10 / CBS 128990) TaxID=675120 RepID=N1Q3J9_DOTSN|nr:hypothetical protein DOTSEDRAFT_31436 [Dothistroma septosporum NZE10]
MRVRCLAITFATCAISNVLAAPAAFLNSDVRFTYSPISLDILELVMSLRVRAEAAPQAQQDANAQLNTAGGEDPKRELVAASYMSQENADQSAKPAPAAYSSQENVKPPTEEPKKGGKEESPENQPSDVKPDAQEPTPHNEKQSAPTYTQQGTVDTKEPIEDTKDQPVDTKESKDQIDTSQLQGNHDSENPAAAAGKVGQMSDQKSQATAEDTQKPKDLDSTDQPVEEKTQDEDQASQAPASYSQGKGQGSGQSSDSSSQRQQASSYSGGAAGGTYSYSIAYTISTCELHGELLCNGLYLFGLCNFGEVFWLPVAEGTVDDEY